MSSTAFKVVIPARFSSSRLPGKVLLDIAGKPMIEHVYERAIESGAEQVVVATDNHHVSQVAKAFGADVCMTRETHCSGTDRIAEVCTKYAWDEKDIVVNLQGDEPLINPELLSQVAVDLQQNTQASISTLCTSIQTAEELFDTNVVKVIMDNAGFAINFSRAAIPWNRDKFSVTVSNNLALTINPAQYNRHIGIYCYRVSFLTSYSSMQSCDLEVIEALEQLRALWYGHKIYVSRTDIAPSHGVDTKQDLLRVIEIFQKNSS